MGEVIQWTPREKNFQAYAHLASAMLHAVSMKCTDTLNAGSVGALSSPVAKESVMAIQEEIDANLEDALKGLWQAAIAFERLAALRIEEGEDPSWYALRATVYRNDCDQLSPPAPCWPSNVIPFVPRRVG